MLVRRPPFKLKVNQAVAVQNPKKTSVRAKKSLKDIFCGTPCMYIVEYSSVSGPWPNTPTIAVSLPLDHSQQWTWSNPYIVHNMYYNLQFNKSYSTANNCRSLRYNTLFSLKISVISGWTGKWAISKYNETIIAQLIYRNVHCA